MPTVKTIGSDLYSTLCYVDYMDYYRIVIKDCCAAHDIKVHRCRTAYSQNINQAKLPVKSFFQ
jgi:hypothetical protein